LRKSRLKIGRLGSASAQIGCATGDVARLASRPAGERCILPEFISLFRQPTPARGAPRSRLPATSERRYNPRLSGRRLGQLTRSGPAAFVAAPAQRSCVLANMAAEHWLPPHITGVPLMYAVVKTGGKQYKVSAGEKLKVEQIPADVGAEVILDQVLMVGGDDNVRVGQPTVAGATVKATVVAHGRGEKVRIFKMRRRKHYQKHQGHRQNYTELRIEAIVG
jgi:large subunit ribosomal protein L21